ncbi:MAG: hypothetical protein QM820_32760 [Minicystis sp.]
MNAVLRRPEGLALLITLVGLERFAHYALRGGLRPLIEARLGLDGEGAGVVRGYITAGVFAAWIVGSVVADRLLGMRRAVLAGATLAAIGAGLTMTPAPFLLAMALWVLGAGLLVPSLQALVGDLHEERHPGRDAAFAWVALAVNIGAFASGLSGGSGAAPIIATLGYAVVAGLFVVARRRMPAERPDLPAPTNAPAWRRVAALAIVMTCVLIAAIAREVPPAPSDGGAPTTETSTIATGLLALVVMFGGLPLAFLFGSLDRAGRPPAGAARVGAGLLVQGAGALILAVGPAGIEVVGMLLSGLGNLVATIAGQSLVSRLAPARSAALAMACWLVVPIAGGFLGPWIGSAPPAAALAIVVASAGGLLIAVAPRVRAVSEEAEPPARGALGAAAGPPAP